jgi:hypothetical protein
MKSSIQPLFVTFIPLAMAGCSTHAAVAPFNVVVRGPASSCSIEVNGHKVTADELLAIARPEATSGRRARIDTDMSETPYRCVGGAIFTLQRAGFVDVDFVAEPAQQK